ncbi:MAG: hypothetical protein JXA90_03475 [Planctomycetes bacterium]|nr:hypothetical protein [Planctomycetota bacterium]
MWKWFKRSVIAALAVGLLGFFVFGKDVYSYVTSSGRMFRKAVKDSVPVEFEIKRARDLLEELVPEMHANLKLIAQEEVEVASLEKEIEREQQALADEEARIEALRTRLAEEKVSYQLGRLTYTRGELVERLNRSFDQYRTASVLLENKEKLLEGRRRALEAAIAKLEKMRLTRLELASQIENLEAQFRLVEAEASTSQLKIDNSKLAQTHRLLSDLRKRLDVSQRVLAREAHFVDDIPIEQIDETSVLNKVDAHFGSKRPQLDSSL